MLSYLHSNELKGYGSCTLIITISDFYFIGPKPFCCHTCMVTKWKAMGHACWLLQYLISGIRQSRFYPKNPLSLTLFGQMKNPFFPFYKSRNNSLALDVLSGLSLSTCISFLKIDKKKIIQPSVLKLVGVISLRYFIFHSKKGYNSCNTTHPVNERLLF